MADRYETEDGRVILAGRRDDEVVTFITERGNVQINYWTGSVVGGIGRVQLQDIPELSARDEWVALVRGSE